MSINTNKKVDYLQLKDQLRKPGLVYLLIYTKTCGPCVQMQPVFDWMAEHEASPHRDHFTFAKIDFYENQQLLGDLITEDRFPCTLVFKHGKEIARSIGMPVNLSMDGFIEAAHAKAMGE